MQIDPIEEWRRLTALYGEMGEVELRELAAGIGDLTDVAQQVLRDELKKRGFTERAAAAQWPPADGNDDETAEDGDLPVEYTWKALLCECQSLEVARQRSEMLRRAGIESWIERPGSRSAIPWDELGVGDLQLQVAADQLDQAQAILSNPIPQEIIEASNSEVPEFEAPACPACGAKEPVLESAEPVNAWRCEECGRQWTEGALDAAVDPSKAEN